MASVQQKMKSISEKYSAAQKVALSAVEHLFPVGCHVLLEGRHGAWVMRVTRHGCEWHDPLTVYGINTATGKSRRFYVGCDKVMNVQQRGN